MGNTYSVGILDKWMVHSQSRMGWDGSKFYHATQGNTIAGNFRLIFLDHSWLWVSETGKWNRGKVGTTVLKTVNQKICVLSEIFSLSPFLLRVLHFLSFFLFLSWNHLHVVRIPDLIILFPCTMAIFSRASEDFFGEELRQLLLNVCLPISSYHEGI